MEPLDQFSRRQFLGTAGAVVTSSVVGSMVRDFVDRVFNGSAKPLLVHLVENDHLDEAELDEIARLLKEKKREP